MVLMSIMVPLGLLGAVSLTPAFISPRLHLVAGAFWLLISLLSLSQWGLIYGAIGCVVGASHLIVMGQEIQTRRSTA